MKMKQMLVVRNNMYKCLVLGLLSFIIPNTAIAQTFTLPVFPDTQNEIYKVPRMFFSQIEWVKNNADSLNIPFVIGVGDIVDFDASNQWEIASKGFAILDKNNINYALALGNHDGHVIVLKDGKLRIAAGDLNSNLRNTKSFNSYFPVYRFKAQRGRWQKGKSDNAYYTFLAGGLDWLVVTLEFDPRQGPVDWANKVITNHPHYNVIIVTHRFLNSKRKIPNSNKVVTHKENGITYHKTYGNLTPQQIYEKLVKKHPNILMVLSGHYTVATWRMDTGRHGNKIYEITQDYQGHKDHGGGYLRLIKINVNTNTISGKMYSPYYNKTDINTKFTFENVPFIYPNEK